MHIFSQELYAMRSQAKEISKRFKGSGRSLNEMLSIIDMTLGDHIEKEASPSPYDLFDGLDGSIERTVHGTRIGRFKPKQGEHPFHTFEIHTKEGETLGYLNMIYSGKPVPCYYLVYVEVLFRFRGRGLGCNILKTYKEFAESKKAVALLDNIIPPEDPTFNAYARLGWEPVEKFIGDNAVNGKGHYMAFVPAPLRTPDLKRDLTKILLKVMKKRPIIDMYDNESMVKRTITEFQTIYKTLGHLFAEELSAGTSTPLMSFMYTKFATKVLGFQRRISSLLGYTGGESIQQIHISEQIRALPIQPFSLWDSGDNKIEVWTNDRIIQDLLGKLNDEPPFCIEELPFYNRPYLSEWMKKNRTSQTQDLRIADLLELGFDPTKLKEIHYENKEYMIERVSGSFVSVIERKKEFLPEIERHLSGMRFRNSSVEINPPCAIIRNRGNAYILYRKIKGIHLEEALNQLRTSPHIKDMNRAAGIDRAMISTVNSINESLFKIFGSKAREEIEDIVFFVPWDLERNSPDVIVDITGIFLNTIWIF